MNSGSWLDGVAIVLPTILSMAGVYISVETPKFKPGLTLWTWRIGLIAIGILTSVVTWKQQAEAKISTQHDREADRQAIAKQFEPVTAELRRIRGDNEILRKQIVEKDRILEGIGRDDLRARQRELDLKFVPSVDIVYVGDRIRIYNRGATNIYFWGDQLGNTPKDTESTPRLIAPSSDSFYYLLMDNMKKWATSTIGADGQSRESFRLFITSEDSKKYVVNGLLWIVMSNGEMTIHPAVTGIVKVDWS